LCTEACKKKIKAFEEEFEQKHGYLVSAELSIFELTVTETALFQMNCAQYHEYPETVLLRLS